MALWVVAAVLGLRFSVFVFKSVDEPTHGFVPHYTAARLLIEGEDVAEFYDDLWFEEQVTRFEPDVRDRFGANPPTMSLMMAPLAVMDYGAARAIWITASFIALLVTAVWLLRVLRIRGAWAPAFLLLVFLYQPAYENLSHGQMYVLALVLLCMAWSGYRRERSPLLGTSLGVLLVTKTAALMMWPLLLVQRRRRALAWGAGAFLTVAVASLPMIGIHAWQRYLVEAAKLPSNPLLAVTAYQTELSFFRHLFGPGGDLIGESVLDVPLLATSLPLIGGLVLLGISVYFAHHRTRSDLIFAAFVLMSLIISPVSQDYHYVMALLPVAILVGHVPSGRISRDGLLLIVGALMIGADLPYRSRRLFDGALALVAYPKLYGALLLWCLALLWSLRQSGGPRDGVAPEDTGSAEAHRG